MCYFKQITCPACLKKNFETLPFGFNPGIGNVPVCTQRSQFVTDCKYEAGKSIILKFVEVMCQQCLTKKAFEPRV